MLLSDDMPPQSANQEKYAHLISDIWAYDCMSSYGKNIATIA